MLSESWFNLKPGLFLLENKIKALCALDVSVVEIIAATGWAWGLNAYQAQTDTRNKFQVSVIHIGCTRYYTTTESNICLPIRDLVSVKPFKERRRGKVCALPGEATRFLTLSVKGSGFRLKTFLKGWLEKGKSKKVQFVSGLTGGDGVISIVK